MDYKEQWIFNFNLAKSYYEKNKDLLVPFDYIENNNKLGRWISRQRQYYRKNKLSIEYINMLNSIGMIWYPFEQKWYNNYNLAKKYYNEFGNLLIPDAYKINNSWIGRWVKKQRNDFNNLSKNKIQKLNSIGMIWNDNYNNVFYNNQTSFQEQMIFYYLQKFVKRKVINRYQKLGFELDIFIPSLKLGIEYDGSYWHKDLNKDLNKNLLCKKHNIQLIRIREKKCPVLSDNNCIIYKLNSNSEKELLKVIEYILNYIKYTFKINIEFFINTDKDKKEIMNKYIYIQDTQWTNNYNIAKQYYKKHNNLLIPNRYKINNFYLGAWIVNQRQYYKNGKLTKEQITKLNNIHMIWDIYEYKWNLHFEQAKAFYKKYGNLDLPYRYIVENFNIGRWLSKQRTNMRKHNLSKIKIEKLNSININWN